MAIRSKADKMKIKRSKIPQITPSRTKLPSLPYRAKRVAYQRISYSCQPKRTGSWSISHSFRSEMLSMLELGVIQIIKAKRPLHNSSITVQVMAHIICSME